MRLSDPVVLLRSLLDSCYRELGVESVVLVSGEFQFDLTPEESLDRTGMLFWFVETGRQTHRDIGFPTPYPFRAVYDPKEISALGWRVEPVSDCNRMAVMVGIWCVFDAFWHGFDTGQHKVVERRLVIEETLDEEVLAL